MQIAETYAPSSYNNQNKMTKTCGKLGMRMTASTAEMKVK